MDKVAVADCIRAVRGTGNSSTVEEEGALTCISLSIPIVCNPMERLTAEAGIVPQKNKISPASKTPIVFLIFVPS